MPNIQAGIKKICTFIFNFSDMNTLFVDQNLHAQLEYGYNAIPEALKPYFENTNNQIQLEQPDSKEHAFFHSTCYHLNFITAKIYDQQDYMGNIIIGPYLLDQPTSLMIENVLFENQLSISLKHLITDYYLSIPLINLYKAKLIAEFLVCNLSHFDFIGNFKLEIGTVKHNFQTKLCVAHNTLIKTTELTNNLIEKRYIMENELMYAVEHGDKEKAAKLAGEIISLTTTSIPDRIPQDPLRSRKNLSFVLNTLLRKASEKGGVPPTKTHSISEKFAIQIERSNTVQEIVSLQKNMIFTYCNSTHKYSLKSYNYLTRKVIDYIRMNLDEDLSLIVISDALNISSYELSRQFKKETGSPITEYINNLRINEAIYFLENQAMSITDIAHMVGFNDVNYFTKVFKKIKGVTPSQYRNRKA